MKKINIILIALLCLIYGACSTEETTQIEETTLYENTVISFKNSKEYQNFFTPTSKVNTITPIGFNSFENKVFSTNKSSEEDNEYLGFSQGNKLFKILNEDRIVKIGAWLCQLDFVNKKVYLTKEENAKTKDLSKSNEVFVADFEEDVLPYLEIAEEGKISLQDARIEWSKQAQRCTTVGSRKKEIDKCSDLEYSENGENFSAKVKLVYQKAGVYFAVESKIKNYRTVVGCNLNNFGDQFVSYGQVLIKRKKGRFGCKTVTEGAHWSYKTVGEGDTSDRNNSDAILTHYLYEGSRGLRDLNVTASLNWSAYRDSYGSHYRRFQIKR